MSEPTPRVAPPLMKLHSWSPGTTHNEEAWRRRRHCHRQRLLCRHQGITDDDVDELRAWFELGFRFDSSEQDPKLVDIFPALEIYHAISKPLGRNVSASEAEMGAAGGGISKALDLGNDPKVVKARLKQWAQVVACVVQQQSSFHVKFYPSSK